MTVAENNLGLLTLQNIIEKVMNGVFANKNTKPSIKMLPGFMNKRLI